MKNPICSFQIDIKYLMAYNLPDGSPVPRPLGRKTKYLVNTPLRGSLFFVFVLYESNLLYPLVILKDTILLITSLNEQIRNSLFLSTFAVIWGS
jgi:hypothetical protein